MKIYKELFLLLFLFTINGLAAQTVVINEIMAANDDLTSLADELGEFDDWVELYNTSSSTVNLEGYFFSDNIEETDKWAFPAGISIPANSYLIVWTDKDDEQGDLHTNFKLSAGGETLILSDPSGTVVDSITFEAQAQNFPAARVPNGTGAFVMQPHTYNANNNGVSRDLVINEFMANNDTITTITDADGEYDDWIELYNNSSTTINLAGYKLTDDYDTIPLYIFPAGINIEGNGYLIIWADNQPEQGNSHATFSLSSTNGEQILLSAPNDFPVDAVNFGPQESAIPMARIPNGTGRFVQQAPTFNGNNEGSNGTRDFDLILTSKIYPNPALNQINFDPSVFDANEDLHIRILNQLGQVVYSEKRNAAADIVTIDISNLKEQFYFVEVSAGKVKMLQKLFLER